MNTSSPTSSPKKVSPAMLLAAALFLVANLTIPFTLGDVYPITVAPMFRDAPTRYENIRVFALNGTRIADNSTRRGDPITAPDPFRLRRYYDGNPEGYGVGIQPPDTLDDFGVIHDEATIRRHIQACLAETKHEAVDVEQEIVGPIDNWRVGVQATHRWRVNRANNSPQSEVQP